MINKLRILELFRHSGGRLISCSELVAGQYYGTKQIIEYTGRITDARKVIGCTCGENKNTCQASEHIVNVRTNWYQYQSSLPKREVVEVRQESVMVNLEEMKYKRLQLVEEYREAKKNGDVFRMSLIERQGKAIKNAIDLEEKKEEVKQSLF